MRSCRYGKILKVKWNKGYAQVGLHSNGRQKDFFVHRLVAVAFIPNIKRKPEVNHIDENKANNCASNLQWVTSKENANHGTRNMRISKYLKAHPIARKGKKVAQIEKETNQILHVYDSVTEAAKKNGFHEGNICWCCTGKRNEANGFKWKYVS